MLQEFFKSASGRSVRGKMIREGQRQIVKLSGVLSAEVDLSPLKQLRGEIDFNLREFRRISSDSIQTAFSEVDQASTNLQRQFGRAGRLLRRWLPRGATAPSTRDALERGLHGGLGRQQDLDLDPGSRAEER